MVKSCNVFVAAYHGLEPLLIDIANALKTYIWIIDTESYISYSVIPELHGVLCRNKENTRIHFCPVILNAKLFNRQLFYVMFFKRVNTQM